MKTVAIISQKGGSGKSTLALHLAVASSQERDTAVIDLDPQASAASWADRREAGTPPVLSAHSSRLPFVMKEVEQAEGPQGSLVILDTAPHADRVALDAAKAADLVLIPARTIEAQGLAVAPVRLVNRVAYARSLMVGQVAQEFSPERQGREGDRCPAHLRVYTPVRFSKGDTTDGRKAKLRS